MSRKAFFSPNLVLTFISADDPAIGLPDGEERATAIAAYARSLDLRKLQLRSDRTPTKFFVKVLSSEQKISLQGILFAGDSDGLAERLSSEVGQATMRALVDTNVVGVSNFALVSGIGEDGDFQYETFNVAVDSPVPSKVRDAIKSDFPFCISLMLFLVTAGQLSDDEKKA